MTGKIIVATDGSPMAGRAVDYAARLSEKLDQDLFVLHVLMHGRPSKEFVKMAQTEGIAVPSLEDDTPVKLPLGVHFPSAEDELELAKAICTLGDRIAQNAAKRARDGGARNVSTRICVGDTADEILDLAEAVKADTLVLGRRGLGHLREVLLGSVSQKVLHHAGCTVVIVQ